MVAKLDQRYIIKRITKLKVVKEIKGVKVIKVYLKGDNKAESTDSRNFGWVAKQKIVGKLLFKL